MSLFRFFLSIYSRFKVFYPVVILLSLALIIYSNVFSAPFIFDDILYISKNSTVHELGNFLAIPWNRYLTSLTFALNYNIGGVESFGYHIVNIAVHFLSSLCVYYLVVNTFRTPRIKDSSMESESLAVRFALFASLIFLVHPVQTQAVSYITQRFTSLATLFYLLSIILYIKARLASSLNNRMGLFIAALLAAVLAQLSKEISFTLPAVLVLYEVTFFSTKGFRKIFTYNILPFIAISLIVPFTLFAPDLWPGVFGDTAFAEEIRVLQLKELNTLSSYNYLLTQFRVIITYMRLMLFPVGQAILYEIPIYKSFFVLRIILSFIFLSIVFFFSCFLLIRSRKSKEIYTPFISFGILWFFITLSVESSIIPIKDVLFEHRLYLPSVGFIIAFMGLFGYVLNGCGGRVKIKPGLSKILWSTLLLVVMVFSVATYKRNIVWADDLLFWMDALEKTPSETSVVIHYNLGVVLTERGRLAEANDYYRHVLKGEPESSTDLLYDLTYNLATNLLNMGRADESIKYFETLLRINPEDTGTHVNLANAFYKLGKLDSVKSHYREALRLDPDSKLIRKNFEIILRQNGNNR